jgi:hypothetical protein
MGLHEGGDHLEGESVRFDAVTEYVGISAHGTSTNVDGLAHYSWDGKTYNGFPESDTTSGHGAKSLSVHHAAHGFVTRGDPDRGPDAIGPAARQAGLHASCLPFLRERDVAVLGNGGIQDVQPSGYSLNLLRPIHAVSLVAMGLWLIDNMQLTELAKACQDENGWEFFFAALPWRMVGVTSSASNPVAVF